MHVCLCVVAAALCMPVAGVCFEVSPLSSCSLALCNVLLALSAQDRAEVDVTQV